MAETYTDSTGKVFPLNAFGRPQGYWDGNKFVFPRFGVQSAAAVPAVDPVTPAPVAPPAQQPGMVVRPPYVFDENIDTTPPQMERTAANNWGYANPFERVVLAGAIPGGGLIGAANNAEAMNMDRTGWSKQFSPSFFDVLTGGLFAGPGYDQSVLNMENWNIAGRPGLFGPKSPYMDYTHSYSGPRTQLGPLGPIQQSFYDDLFGINQPGIDPFGGIAPSTIDAVVSTPFNAGEDDIGEIDPMSNVDFSGPFSDPFGDIADALGGEDAPGGYDDPGGYGDMGGFT